MYIKLIFYNLKCLKVKGKHVCDRFDFNDMYVTVLIFQFRFIIEGFINEVKWITALLSTEGGARMDNDALKPRLKAEVSMEGYHFLS